MTLITVGIEPELLRRQLHHRLGYVAARIASVQPKENADNFVTALTATGALLELRNEHSWLLTLLNQLQQEEVQP